MTKKAVKHIQHYLPLLGLFTAGIIGFSVFSFDRSFQFFITLGVSFAYVTWGVVHHYLHKDLHLSVIIEYIIFAALGIFIMASVIFRA